METAAVDDEVPDGDMQSEEAGETMTSPAPEHVTAEEGDNDAGQLMEEADDPGTATEPADELLDEGTELYGGNELPEPETTLRRQSLDDSTEPPPASSLHESPEPGILLYSRHILCIQK